MRAHDGELVFSNFPPSPFGNENTVSLCVLLLEDLCTLILRLTTMHTMYSCDS
jgi:hypothetical protein